MTDPKPLPLVVGHTYRAKRPANAHRLANDRTILWLGPEEVQYDGPGVPLGRHFPKVTHEKFRAWADRDVTDELPTGAYADWPLED